MSDDDQDNVVHLGTGDLAAIGKVLRDMYAFYVDSKPPERIERLVAMIDKGGRRTEVADADGNAPRPDVPPT